MRGLITYLRIRNSKCRLFIIWRTLIILLFFIYGTDRGYSQSANVFKSTDIKYISGDVTSEYHEPKDNYDELLITLNVQRIGSIEIPAIIYGQKVYLSVKDLFDFIKIRNTPSAEFDSVAGFFINPNAAYLIDKINNKIIYQNKIFNLRPNDVMQTPTALFLRSDYFGEVFGLECVFNFRSLSVTLNTKIELPAIREMRQDMMRKNISQLKGEKKADTIIRRSFPCFIWVWLIGR